MVLLLVATVGSGCSLWRKDAAGPEVIEDDGTTIESTDLIEDELAGQPSLEQFEATGTVAAGGTFEDVNFAFDSVEFDAEANMAIRHNGDLLIGTPDIRVEIEGHCDDRGTSEYNLALGARRAKAVRDALAAHGVAPDRLSTVSYGEELPLCKEQTEECWARNRRAHLVDLSR